MDAILAYDAEGNPIEPEWPEADVIIGNPPFLGDKKMRGELGDKYVDDLRRLYRGRITPAADLVCYWFGKAGSLVESKSLKRVGLLATNSIRGGANRQVLDYIKQVGDIFWAIADRDWILDGAAVNVSMIAFDSGAEQSKLLDGKAIQTINSDLTYDTNLTLAKTLRENENISFVGTQKSGPFDLTEEKAKKMLLASGNPNGRHNRDVVKPWINAIDITQVPRHMWIVDFGTSMSLDEAAGYEAAF